jgi:hypothetical protein
MGILCYPFSDSGFPFENGKMASLCQSTFHTRCIFVGAPFMSQHKNAAGLCFPDITEWGTI